MKFLLPVIAFLLLSAHIGSPDVFYEGHAGAYGVRVRITPPQVVPGLAQVSVRVAGGAERVTVAPGRSDTGREGQPPADVAVRDGADPELFTTPVWIMARGAYRIVIQVSGARGEGTAIVPVTAMATTRLPMSRPLTWVLLGTVLFLLAGLISIIGAAVRESVLPPGQRVTPERQRFARRAMVGGALVTLLVLFGGWSWWRAVDTQHKAALDRPWQVEARVSEGMLHFAIVDSIWAGRARPMRRLQAAPIIADHGKLMHMFLIRDDQAAFAHVHPTTTNQDTFTVALPALPPGSYRVYADIVHESGYTQTLTSRVSLGESKVGSSTDVDDTSWAQSTSGEVLQWELPPTVRANEETSITVQSAMPLQPYMGMPGHAVVEKTDGNVFIHLHPAGTISMAAQAAVVAKTGDTVGAHSIRMTDRVSFPYAFPQPGKYRVWVQVRTANGLITEARDVVVNNN